MIVEPAGAIVEVLKEAGEPLHRTVIQDRVLKAGGVDPFTTPDVRGVIARAIQQLVADGTLTRVSTGVYVLAPPAESGAQP